MKKLIQSKGILSFGLLFALSMGLVLALMGCPGKTKEKAPENKPVAVKPAPKTKVEFFVMSQCPYGVQVEQAIAPVIDKFGESVDLSIDFIGSENDGGFKSLHGEPEVKGNQIQLCVMKHHPGQALKFINCMNKDYRAIPGNWEACAQEMGLNAVELKTCYEGPEAVELARASFARSQAKGANSSPTIYIGGQKYDGPRGELPFSRAICDAFPGEKPELCAMIPPPVKVAVTIVSDKRCPDCATEGLQAKLSSVFPGCTFNVMDYSDEAGKKFYTDNGLTLLPAILFGKDVEQADSYANIQRFLRPRGEYLELNVGAKFDPTKEICDNGSDDTGNGKIDCDDDDCKEDMVCRKEIPKRLDVFVMSQCPYGVRALNAMEEVLKNFNNGIDFNIYFIATAEGEGFKSLHGQPEVDEDIRELCAIKHYKKNYKYMDYILCRNKNISSTNWQECTGSNGIDTKVIEKCFAGEGPDLFRENIKVAAALGIGASPTWLANNKYKFSGVAANDIKTQVCTYNQGLKNCDKQLSGPPSAAASAADKAACGAK